MSDGTHAFGPADIPIIVDPDMPPGVIELRSGDQVLRVTNVADDQTAGQSGRLSPLVVKMRNIIDSPDWVSPCEHASPCWWVDEDGICHCGYCPAIWMVP